MKNLLTLCLFVLSFPMLAQTVSLEQVNDCETNQLSDALRINKPGTWHDVYRLDFTMPKEYKKVDFFHQIIDYDQVVYQSCRSLKDQKWNDDRLTHFINRWGVDTLTCSAQQINSFINGVVASKGTEKTLFYAIDENNNFDFSDDTFYPIEKDIQRSHNLVFERFENEILLEDQVTIHLGATMYDKKEKVLGFKFNYCESKKGELMLEGQKITFHLSPGDWYAYHKNASLEIITPEQSFQNILIGHYFQVKGTYYQVASINKMGSEIYLEKYEGSGQPNCRQAGFPAPPIMDQGKNVLDQYQGQYVYLYLWNIDCGACEMSLPPMYEAYQQKYGEDSNISFLMVSVDKPKAHQKFIKKHQIEWPNIQTFGNSNIFNDYQVVGFPTKVLIGPDGKVIETSNFSIQLDKVLNNTAPKK